MNLVKKVNTNHSLHRIWIWLFLITEVNYKVVRHAWKGQRWKSATSTYDVCKRKSRSVGKKFSGYDILNSCFFTVFDNLFKVIPIICHLIFTEWVEFSPYEIGMPKYGAYMNSELFGSKFFMGKLVKSYGEPPLHFLQGTPPPSLSLNLQTMTS